MASRDGAGARDNERRDEGVDDDRVAERMFHPECSTDDWFDGCTLYLVDFAQQRNVGRMRLTGAEWTQLRAAGVDRVFSGQVPQVSWNDADHQVRSVIGRGFEVC